VHTGAYAEQVDTESGVNIWSIHNHLRFRATGSILDSTTSVNNCQSQTQWYRSWNKAEFRKMVPWGRCMMKKETPHFICQRRSSADMGTLTITGFPCLSTTCNYMMLRLVCGVYYECNQDWRKLFFLRDTEFTTTGVNVCIFAAWHSKRSHSKQLYVI